MLAVPIALITGSAAVTQLGGSTILETKWTRAAARAYAASPFEKQKERSLPELRVYDAGSRLALRTFGFTPGKVGRTIVQSIRQHQVTAGPSLEQSLAELETRDGTPALAQARAGAKIIIVDYWASWCAPCKVLGKELDTWAARQPKGFVRIVRAETDLIAASHKAGEKVFMIKKGPDGKMIKTEVQF